MLEGSKLINHKAEDCNQIQESDFRQDRGGLMIKKNTMKRPKSDKNPDIVREYDSKDEDIMSIELWALPCYIHRDKIRKYEMNILIDKEIPTNT